jgi:PAS domain S-box-containing protein
MMAPETGYAMLCQQIVEGIPDALIFADENGTIRLWNGGAEALFGFTATEAIGQRLDLIIPERLRERHWDGYRRVMATGVTRYGRALLAVPAIRKDGARISIEFSILLLRNSQGKALGSAAMLRDVTARRQREKELKQRLSALDGK